MTRSLAAVVLLLAPSLILTEGWWNPGVDEFSGGEVDSSIVLKDGAGICAPAPETDIPPNDVVIQSASCYRLGTQVASNVIIAAGDDEMSITVDTAGGAEVGVIVTQTCKGVALPDLTEGVHFACSGLSDAVCAANLAVAIAAQSGTCVTATSSGAVVSPQPIDCNAYMTSFASTNGAGGGTAFVTSNGTDGLVIVTGRFAFEGTSSAHPAWQRSGTDLEARRADSSAFTNVWVKNSYASTDVRVGASGKVHSDGRTEINFPADGVARFTNDAVTGFGSVQLGPARATDAEPSDSSVLGANSWAQATGETRRTGGALGLAGGLGTLQIICDDYADGALDEMVIETIIAGTSSVATLVEGTDWDCITSDTVCCNNLGAAIVTEYGAGGLIVPDCATLGGTCYLTPSATLDDVNLSITNNAADPFASLVEGDNGPVKFATYTRHHDIPIGAATLGPTAPAESTIGTFRCKDFDDDGDEAFVSVEVPSEWNRNTDMIIDLLLFTESGDALANGEIIQYDLQYRSVAIGEAYDNGTVVSVTASVTGGVSETDKGQYKISATIDYDNGNQPLTADDTLGAFISRDVTGVDTYTGITHLCRAQLVYGADSLATH